MHLKIYYSYSKYLLIFLSNYAPSDVLSINTDTHIMKYHYFLHYLEYISPNLQYKTIFPFLTHFILVYILVCIGGVQIASLRSTSNITSSIMTIHRNPGKLYRILCYKRPGANYNTPCSPCIT